MAGHDEREMRPRCSRYPTPSGRRRGGPPAPSRHPTPADRSSSPPDRAPPRCVARRGKSFQSLVAFEDLAEIVRGRKKPRLVEMREQMHRVGGEHHEAALGLDPDALQAMAWPPMWCRVMPGAISLTPSWNVTRPANSFRTIERHSLLHTRSGAAYGTCSARCRNASPCPAGGSGRAGNIPTLPQWS